MTVSTRSNPTPPAPATKDPAGAPTVPMVLLMPAAAPQLKSTSHASLVHWRNLRREYEDEVAMRCSDDADKMAEVLLSTFNKRLLEVWCEFDWGVNIETVTDEFILGKIDEIIWSVINNSVSDVAALFKENVVLDMTESDVKERVMQFFAKSREFIEKQGWQEFFTGKKGLRLKCKLLPQPRGLREELATTVKYQVSSSKENEKERFKSILAKAFRQDWDFQRRKRSRSKDQSERKKNDTNEHGGDSSQPRSKYRKVERNSGRQAQEGGANKQNMGDHWVAHCPTASAEEKKDLLQKVHERRDSNKASKRAGREA
ncbi:LOW QUALITY PROTEIN: hypothetical protein PHMEG_0006114 [Phytophthora megakarya]|uniref:Cleavage induced protein n=1 Tax=Phytophthora megakarya TaxID=4795 RepID=A0A225WRF2_9STRA|nr:LOW QUALITY PROTEIN: hypothetical protein PHMEG_0006114 [Phytophthora megakarya]